MSHYSQVKAMKQLLMSLVAALVLFTSDASTQSNPNFTKITAGAIVQDSGGTYGQAWGDYDNDGDLDLALSVKSGNNLLFQNNGDGSFNQVTTGPIATEGGNSRAILWGDYDNDGSLDLFAANWSNGGKNNYLYHNNGDGSFTKITSGAVVTDGGSSIGAAWGDYDNDGFIDLFVANQGNPKAEVDFLYRNNHDGTFSRVMDNIIATNAQFSQGAAWCDYDRDGLIDLYVTTGSSKSSPPNLLYRNLGSGQFQSVTPDPSVTDNTNAFGVSWADYDRDGDADLLVCQTVGPSAISLFRNKGDGSFEKVVDSPLSLEAVATAGAWGDYDNDGDMDLFTYRDGPGQNALFENLGNGAFQKLFTGTIAADMLASGVLCHSASWVDYDRDGDLDLFVAAGFTGDASYDNLLYRNDGNANNWISIRLAGITGTSTAVGAKVWVAARIGGVLVRQVQDVTTQSAFLSQPPQDLHFGLADAVVIDTIRIEWPTGIIQTFMNVTPNQFFDVTQSSVSTPPATAAMAPASGSRGVAIPVELAWDSVATAQYYIVEVSTDSLFLAVVVRDTVVGGTSTQLGTLSYGTEYFWHVIAVNAAGLGPASSPSCFTTVLGPPTLGSPLSGSIGHYRSVTFAWHPVVGAQRYRLQLSTDSLFASGIVTDDSTLADTTVTVNGLTDDLHFSWRVSARDPDGAGPFSGRWDFETTLAPPPLASPPSGSDGLPSPVSLVWEDVPGADWYQVEVAPDSLFAVGVETDTVASPTADIPSLAHFTEYFWRVRAMRNGVTGPHSDRWNFTTVVGSPALVAPGPGSLVYERPVRFAWQHVAGASSYHLQVGADSLFATGILVEDSTLVDTTAALNGLVNGSRYFWRVRARNSAGSGAFSERGDFVTSLEAVELNHPANASNDQAIPLALNWFAVAGTDSYYVQVATDTAFTSPSIVIDAATEDSAMAIIGLKNDTQYFWRVRAHSVISPGVWSVVWTFRTILETPQLIAPLGSSLNQPTTLELHWGAVKGALSYQLQVSVDNGFATGVTEDLSAADTVASLSGLEHNTIYFWRVRAVNAFGASAFSLPRSFETRLATPVLIWPPDGATGLPTDVEVRWLPVRGAVSYVVQVGVDSIFSGKSTLEDTTAGDTSRALTGLAHSTPYYWRIQARKAGGASDYARGWDFTTTVGLPVQITLVSPAHGVILSGTNTMFVWRPGDPLVDRYWFELSKDSLFSSRTIDSTITDTSYVHNDFATGGAYWWRVRAHNAAGWGQFSKTETFSLLITDVSDAQKIPNEFVLFDSYPNPFNPSTVIRFGLPARAEVRLTVYNMLGQEVRSLVNGTLEAGYHEVRFDGAGLATGLYLYRLEAGPSVATRKMVLVK